MSYLDTTHDPQGEVGDHSSTNIPAPGRGQTSHPIRPLIPSAMPAANNFPRIDNPLRNEIGGPVTCEYCHTCFAPAPVTGRQQQYGGQRPQSASSVARSILSDSRHSHGTASIPHPSLYQRHPDGVRQDSAHAQRGWRRAVDPPHIMANRVPYEGGGMSESRRIPDTSNMLPANMPYPEYWNVNDAGQDNGFITHTAVSNANDGTGDVRSINEDFSSQPEPWQPAMMPLHGNTTMDMENTAPPGNHMVPVSNILPQGTNAPFQTLGVNAGYEPSGVPEYNQHIVRQLCRDSAPTHPVHQPLQPWDPFATQASLNNDGCYSNPISAFTHGQPYRRKIGMAPNNIQTLPHHPSHLSKLQADQLPETHSPLRTMPSSSDLPSSVPGEATDQTDADSRKAGRTQHPELAIPGVVDRHLPASRRSNICEPARSNVAPQLSPTKRKRSQSSSPPRGKRERKGRELAPLNDYEKSKKAFVRREKLACDRCKADKTKCMHWDQEIFRSHYEASNASNTPTSHSTASETRRTVRRPRPSASICAIAPSQRLRNAQTSSTPTLVGYPEQTDRWGNTLAHTGGQLDVPAGLTSPVSAAAVLQGHSRHQYLSNFDTMTHTASESMHGPVRPMPLPFTAGETPSQDTAVMQIGMHFGSHTDAEQQLPTSSLFSELDEVGEPQQYLSNPYYNFTLLPPTNPNPDDDFPPQSS